MSEYTYHNNPFTLEAIEEDKFKFSIDMGEWSLTKYVDENALEELEAMMLDVRGLSPIIRTFKCTPEQADSIRTEWNRDWVEFGDDFNCNKCKHKNKACFDCLFVCQSPLERQMLIAFLDYGLDVILQKRIRKDGTSYDFPEEVDGETILTIPDFYIEASNGKKICIYADGKTYHYSDESQGIRDRNIDRELQKLGYVVLRYTGYEIREDCNSIIDKIKEYLS